MHLLAIYIRRSSVLSQLPHNLLVALSPGKVFVFLTSFHVSWISSVSDVCGYCSAMLHSQALFLVSTF